MRARFHSRKLTILVGWGSVMELVVQSLWIRDELSTMERLSVRSFLAHGYQVDLHDSLLIYGHTWHINGTAPITS